MWAPARDRESIFRSLQSRRTYAATDKIQLIFRSGDHWMGEIITTNEDPEFQIEIEATGPIKWIEVIKNGRKPVDRSDYVEFDRNSTSIRATFGPLNAPDASYYVYIHVVQEDGNQAWSSPIWIKRPQHGQ